MEFKELLRKAGFSEKEANVYLALLTGGPSGATEIAERACINRSTTYVVLDALSKRGLVSSGGGSVAAFSAGAPNDLVGYFKRAASHFRDLAAETESLIPSLKKAVKDRQASATNTYGSALSSLGSLHMNAKRGELDHSSKKNLAKPKFSNDPA